MVVQGMGSIEELNEAFNSSRGSPGWGRELFITFSGSFYQHSVLSAQCEFAYFVYSPCPLKNLSVDCIFGSLRDSLRDRTQPRSGHQSRHPWCLCSSFTKGGSSLIALRQTVSHHWQWEVPCASAGDGPSPMKAEESVHGHCSPMAGALVSELILWLPSADMISCFRDQVTKGGEWDSDMQS